MAEVHRAARRFRDLGRRLHQMGLVQRCGLQERNLIRTSRGPVELPRGSVVGQEQFTPEARAGIDHPAGVWFNQSVREHSFRSEKYDTAYTLLHLGDAEPKSWAEEKPLEDTFQRFMRGYSTPAW